MEKSDNIFNLYAELKEKAIEKGLLSQFIREWAKEIGTTFNSIKNNWILSKEIPGGVDERHLDWAIRWLQNAIKLQNEIKDINVKL